MKITIDIDTTAQTARFNAGGAVYYVRVAAVQNKHADFEITNPSGYRSTSKTLPDAVAYLLNKAFRLAKQPRSYSLGDEAGAGIPLAAWGGETK